jgi:acetylornithine deacetylase/succinyl-diaminopimelate desuccinylase-like protein
MELDALETLKKLVSYPSISADSAYKQGLKDARDFLQDTLQSMGFKVESIETDLHPILFAERRPHPDAPTVMIYGHYDVQPADPFELWDTDPFKPTVKDGRIYGRGAADNKGPVSMLLAVVSQILTEQPDLPLNLCFLLEGEEEIGSPSFKPVLEAYKERFKADFLLACDSGSQKSDQIVVTAGLRGITCLEVKVKGPHKDLHSGVYGGAVLNPIKALMDICQSLHNEDGTVNIPGFYDKVLPVENWEREELKQMNLDEQELKEFLKVPEFMFKKGFSPFEAIRFGPTLEYNGVWGGYQGEGSKTIIPSEANVKISCRLVADQDPLEIQELVIKTIAERAPKGVELEFIRDHNGKAYLVVPPGRPNTPPDQNEVLAKAFQLTEKLSESEFGKPAVYLREGGSIPIINDIKDVLGLDTLLIGFYLPDDGYHAPNESFSLEMMEKGQKLLKRLFEGISDA